MEFGILGPLRIRGDDGEILVSGSRRRAVLIRLLVSANQPVSAERLAEDVWDGSPPPGAASTLQSHISFLRRTLGADRICHRDGAYWLDLDHDVVDTVAFEQEAADGKSALSGGDPGAAVDQLAGALSRWRGPALADVHTAAWAVPEATRLEELRLGTVETWHDALLVQGQHAVVVASAEAAVVEHPLRERLWAQLMLALYRSGRQSAALRAYQRLRTHLVDELGIEPCPDLSALESAILEQSHELDWSAPGPPTDSGGPASRRPSSEVPLPTGAVTLLFTDIESSTALWERDRDAMNVALDRHHELLRSAIAHRDGHVFNIVGDAFCAAFSDPKAALAAAVDCQQSLRREPWPTPVPIRVRIALHAGTLEPIAGDYRGPVVNRIARLLHTAHGGQTVLSGMTHDLVRDDLPPGVSLRDLGEHRLKDLGRPERIYQLDMDALPTEFPPLRTLDNPDLRHNLPFQASSFVGRDGQIRDLRALLGRERLVTLTGVGGVGKTRLALQVAAETVDEHRDGVWLVELAPLSDPESIARSVAAVLGVPGHSDRPTAETIVTYLRDRDVLVVLDNCEHVIGAAARLAAQLLSHCPGVNVLATSREPLNVAGEAVVRVPPLEVPSPAATGLSEISEFEAVRLFCERAVSHQPGFTLASDNCVTVALVCRRLDGIPLAIELAATRLRSLSVVDVSRRLDQRFRLLTGGDRAVLPRQQTLEATVDWSYDLLTPDEQDVFCRLSTFAGTWSLAGACAICATGEGDPWSVEEAVDSLVDKNLVQIDSTTDELRYRLLETIRAYGAERLAAKGEERAAALDRHARFYLDLAEEAAPNLVGSDQVRWISRLEVEHDNLREALAHLSEDGAPVEQALRLGVALRWFWFTRGYYDEGVEFLRRALAGADGDGSPEHRAGALLAVGTLYQAMGDYDRAGAVLEESCRIARGANLEAVEADGLCELAWLAFQTQELERSVELADRAATLARQVGDDNLLGFALSVRGGATYEEDRSRASRDIEDAIACLERSGDRKRLCGTLCRLGIMELEAGDFDRASVHLQDVRQLALELDDGGMLPFIHSGLGYCALLGAKDVPRARAFFGDALAAARRVEDGASMAYAALGLAFCAVADGDRRAVAIHGLADGLIATHVEELDQRERVRQAAEHDVLRGEWGDAGFQTEFLEGRQLALSGSFDVAFDYAWGDHDAPSPAIERPR